MAKCTTYTFLSYFHLCFYFVNFSYNILTKHLITKHENIFVCICVCLCVLCMCMYVYLWWKRLCVFYAVSFVVNADIMTKLDKFSTISRCIDNDNLHAKNVWQMPPVSPIVFSIRFRNFVHSSLIAKLSFGLLSLSFSIYVRHKYANTRRDKNATVICDIIILPYFDISYK